MDNIKRKAQHLPYHYDDPKLIGDQTQYLDLVYQFNQLRPSQTAEKEALLHKMFAEVGPQTHIEAPFHANWGGHDVHLGAHVYCNFNMTMVDDAPIYIGDDCMFGPNVVIATSGHPVLPVLRKHGYVYNFPVTIGNNVWVGAGVQILPGVTIGENTVIGAGSVVTHDIPANVVAFGSPCKVARPIGDKDKEYYFKNHRLDVSD